MQVTEPTTWAAGAGPSTINAKFVNWVRLTDLETGRPVYVLNNHAVPSVQSKTGGPNRRSPARLKITASTWTACRACSATSPSTTGAWCFVTGDLNVNSGATASWSRRSSPTASSARWGWRRVTRRWSRRASAPTLRSGNDTRLIDHTYFLPRKPLQPAGQLVRASPPRPHRPLVVDFDVKVSRQVDTTSPDARRPPVSWGRRRTATAPRPPHRSEAPLGRTPRRVVLHVGTPKSGTTFLQQVPVGQPGQPEGTGVPLRRAPAGRHVPRRGQAPRVARVLGLRPRRARQVDGPPPCAGRPVSTTAPPSRKPRGCSRPPGAGRPRVRRARGRRGAPGAVRATSPDRRRRVAERVKNGGTRTFAKVRAAPGPADGQGHSTRGGSGATRTRWGSLDRWVRHLPADHVHVVVAPASSADPTCCGVGSPRGARARPDRHRRDGAAPGKRQPGRRGSRCSATSTRRWRAGSRHPQYGRVVKSQFAERVLSQTSARPQCPPELVERLRLPAEDRNRTIRERGYVDAR